MQNALLLSYDRRARQRLHHFSSFLLHADEFRSKVACENDVVQLMCNPYSRIAIYGASYGRTEYESLQCAQPSGVKEDFERELIPGIVSGLHFVTNFPLKACPAAYTTETVMKICHGQRKCSLTADSATFGRPCKPETRMYLKVVYTCGKAESVFISRPVGSHMSLHIPTNSPQKGAQGSLRHAT
jgi:Galactose binding lectin domain